MAVLRLLTSKHVSRHLLDLFGAASVTAAILYYFWGHSVTPKDDELAALWANLSTEGIGIWLTVRIIDRLIKSNERWKNARVGMVRNCRFLLRISKIALAQKREIDLDHVETELKYSRQRLDRCKDLLDAEELKSVTDLHSQVEKFVSELNDLLRSIEKKEMPEIISANSQVITGSVALIEADLWIVEMEILDETPED